jgi:hypothetical protein
MKKYLFGLLLVLTLSCEKNPKKDEVVSHLKKAMTEFLFESVNKDTSVVKFDVKEVIYFEDKNFYECEFNVQMKQNGKDTLGIMKARVTKDFSKVNRKS